MEILLGMTLGISISIGNFLKGAGILHNLKDIGVGVMKFNVLMLE